jgi:hypothetical protein
VVTHQSVLCAQYLAVFLSRVWPSIYHRVDNQPCATRSRLLSAASRCTPIGFSWPTVPQGGGMADLLREAAKSPLAVTLPYDPEPSHI